MRKVLWALAGVIAVLLVIVLVAPSFIDWNGHKGEIAQRVRAATGRDLKIGGNLSLAVLPSPRLSAEDVRLANAAGAASPDMVRVKAVRVSLKLLPLLGGRIEVASIEIVEPVVELETFADGRNNWTFAATPSVPVVPPRPAERRTEDGETEIRLDSVRIDNGTIVYRDGKAKTVERIERIAAQAAAESLDGPFSLNGKLVAHGVPMNVDVTVGALGSPRPAPLNVSVMLAEAGARLQLAGTVENAHAAARLKARLKGDGPDLARVVRALGGEAPAMLAHPFTIEAAVDGTDAAVSIDDLVLQLAETRAAGNLRAALGAKPDAKATLRIALLDLDKLLAAPVGPGGAGQPAQPAAAAATPAAAAAFALPKDIAAAIDLSVDAVAYKGSQIRNTHIVASLRDGALRLTEASLRPPGGAVTLTGALTATDGKPQFDGNVRMRSDDLRTMMAWLKLDTAGVPGDRLRSAAITGKLKADASQVQFTDAKLELDGAEMVGGAVVALRERPAFGLSLSIDQFNADAYLPSEPPRPVPGVAPGAAAGPAQQPQAPAPAPLAVLKDFDANLALRVGSLTYRKTAIRGIAFDATLLNGTLTVKEASVRDLAGARANVAGTLASFDGFPTFRGTVALEAQDSSGVLRVAGLGGAAEQAKALGRVSLNARTDTSADRLRIDANLDAAGGKARIAGDIANYEKSPRVDLALTVNHPNFAQLMRTLNDQFRPSNDRMGAVSVSLHLKGDEKLLELKPLDVKLGPATLAGEASLALAGARPKLVASLNAGEINADWFLPAAAAAAPARPAAGAAGARAAAPGGAPWSREPLDTAELAALDADVRLNAKIVVYRGFRVDDLKLAATLADRVLNVPELTGRMLDGTFDGKARLAAQGTPSLETTLSIVRANVAKALLETGGIDIASGTLDFTLQAAGAGRSEHELVSALNGNAKLAVRNGEVKGFDLSAVSQRLHNIDRPTDLLGLLQSGMSGGATKFSALDGTFQIRNGVMQTNDLKLVAQAGEGTGKGNLNLPAWTMDMDTEFRLTEHRNAPPFGMRLRGALDNPQKTFLVENIQNWLLQRGAGELLRRALPGAQPQQQPQTQQQPQQPQQPRQTRPEDVLRGLLDGLRR